MWESVSFRRGCEFIEEDANDYRSECERVSEEAVVLELTFSAERNSVEWSLVLMDRKDRSHRLPNRSRNRRVH